MARDKDDHENRWAYREAFRKLVAGDPPFEVWFISEFGEEPHAGKSLKKLEQEFLSADERLFRAREAFQERQVWMRNLRSAYQAWNAPRGKEAKR